MEFYHFVVNFFRDGGFFLYPLAAIFVVGVAIAIERFIYLSVETTSNRRLWGTLVPLINAGNFKQVVAITSKSKAAIATVLNYGIARLASARRRDDVEKAMQEGIMEIVPRLEKRTHYLGTFANLATLVGLLGTVSGLISAFSAVAMANPAEKANMFRDQLPPDFVPGSLVFTSLPAGTVNSSNPATGLIDIRGIDVPAGNEVRVEFNVTLLPTLANRHLVVNQAQLLSSTGTFLADSDDPTVNGQADPDPAVDDEDPTVVRIGAPPVPPTKALLSPASGEATIGEDANVHREAFALGRPADIPREAFVGPAQAAPCGGALRGHLHPYNGFPRGNPTQAGRHQRRAIERNSRAFCQSRCTVRSVTPRHSAISASDKPPK